MEELPHPEMPEKQPSDMPTSPSFGYPVEQRVRTVILAQFALCIAGALVGLLLYQITAFVFDWGNAALAGSLPPDATAADRWQMRWLLTLNHATTFLLPGAVVVWLFYRRYRPHVPGPWLGWRDYLGLHPVPRSVTFLLAIAIMLVSLPLVLWTYEINRALPIPDALREMEAQAEEAVKALLVMDDLGEFLANLFLIALLPAMGEELVFRGVLQRQLMRRMGPWAAILVAGAVFSFIHFQFEGFLPRWFLGIVLGWLYWRSGSLWVPMLAHFFNNGFQVVGQYLYKNDLSAVDLEKDISVPWYVALASAMFLFLLMQFFEKQVSPKEEAGIIPPETDND